MHDAGLIEVVGEVLTRGAVEPRYRALIAHALGRRGVGDASAEEEQKRLTGWIVDMI